MQNIKFTYNYHAPNDLYLITDNPYQFEILQYLIQLQNGFDKCFASIETLRLGHMARAKAHKTIKELIEKEFIDYKKSDSFTSRIANEYFINYDKINYAIMKALSNKDLAKKAHKELTEQQKRAITIKNNLQHPEWLEESNRLNETIGYNVGDNAGK